MAAAAMVAAWGLGWPCEVAEAQPRRPRTKVSVQGGAAEQRDVPSLDEFVDLWGRPLRRPSADLPGGASGANGAGTAATSALPLNVNLVGTIVETGHSRAVFSTPNGAIELKGVGEIVGGLPGGPEVVEIEAKHVVLRFQGRLTTLRLKGGDES